MKQKVKEREMRKRKGGDDAKGKGRGVPWLMGEEWRHGCETPLMGILYTSLYSPEMVANSEKRKKYTKTRLFIYNISRSYITHSGDCG